MAAGGAAASAGPAGPASSAFAATPLPVTHPAAAGFDAGRLATLQAAIDAATQPGGYLGAVALLARGGKLVLWQAWGQRDLARASAMPRDAIFRLYSMSKPVASVAALMLVEQGLLALDQPLARHLPAFASAQVFAGGSAAAPRLRPAARQITLRHLLTHTAGFATGGTGPDDATRLLEQAHLGGAADLAQFAQRAATVPLANDPGARFGYDGVNTEVLSRLVEVASGQRFDEFLRQRIFVPLGMADTGFEVPPDQRHRIADITTESASTGVPTLALAPGRSATAPGVMLNPYFSGAGGLYSTAPDYLRFCQALLNGGALDGAHLLRPQTVALMMQNQLAGAPGITLTAPTPLPAAEGFGLGGYVVLDAAQHRRRTSTGAFGWMGAASTTFTIDPRQQLIAILLMQHLPGESGTVLPKLADPFYNLVYQALVGPAPLR